MIKVEHISIKWLALAVFVISIAVHFAYFGHPNSTVFDEVHFGKFISGYFTGQYFFDIHPPLGKLIISGAGYLANFKPDFDFAEIGAGFPNSSYLWLRFMPTLAGTLLPVIVFLLALQLGISKWSSLTAGIMIAFENSFLVQSRFMLLDSFLLLFGFSALLCYLIYLKSGKLWLIVAAGALAALATLTKWTGGGFLVIIGILHLIQLVRERRAELKQNLLNGVLYLIIIPVIIYFAFFALHFGLLYKSGQGDAFMTPEFRKTLEGTQEYGDDTIQPIGLWDKFIELNEQMYLANARLDATHPYSSKWYTWPLMLRPIYYWIGSTPGSPENYSSRIYLIGNPVIWWSSTIAILFLIITTTERLLRKIIGGLRHRFKPPDNENLTAERLIVAGFVINLLPFVGIGRVMFLYHYMTAYIFAILSLSLLTDKMIAGKNKLWFWLVFITIAVSMFLYFSPFSYGLPIPEEVYNSRFWFGRWK